MSYLPSDEEIRRQLVDVRHRVMTATRELSSPRRSTRFRTTRNLVVAGAAGIALTAGALIVTASQQQITFVADCYESADTGREPVSVVFDGSDGRSSYKDEGLNPVDICADAWAVGVFEPGPPPPSDRPIYPVPPLTACMQNNGVVAVFPNREELPADRLCGTLGLAVWDPDSGV